MTNCRKCGVELNDTNWSSSRRKTNRKICKECHKEESKKSYLKNKDCVALYKKEWFLNHKEEIIKYKHNYYLKNIEKIKEKKKIYFEKNKSKHNERSKKYYNTIIGRSIIKKINSRRKRNLGFNELNSYFIGSEAHHINLNDVIYIPINIHKSISHNIWKDKNMVIINFVAYFFLLQQNIKEVSKIW